MSTTEKAPRSEAPNRRPTGRRGRWIASAQWPLIVIGSVVAAGLLLVGGLSVAHAGEALPGVQVAGAEVGGMGAAEIRAVLSDIVASRRQEPVTFTHDGTEFSYTPGPETYGADLDAAVEAALAAGRDGGPLAESWAQVQSLWNSPREVELPEDVHRERVLTWVTSIADEVDVAPFEGRASADPRTLAVTTEMPRDGLRVVRGEAVDLALDAILEPGPETFELPVVEVEALVSPENVERVAAQMERALEEPLVLSVRDLEVTLEPRDLARLMSSTSVPREGGAREFLLEVPVGAVWEVFAPHLDEIELDPRDARFRLDSPVVTFDTKNDTTWKPRDADVAIVPSKDGEKLDAFSTAGQLEGILVSGRHAARLELRVARPELTTEDARALGITKLIGTFTTYHACCGNRVQNIQRMADLVRGVVLRPGEELSVNEHVGERTRAKGFLADGTIVRGEYVEEVGGGVSQFATTSYNAAFFAGLEIVEHKAHSYYISRYPMGREATLYYPSVDLRIRNTTQNGVYIHTSYTGTSITVSIYGDNGLDAVRALVGQPSNFKDHRTIYRENKSLRPGTQRVVQAGGTGFDVTVTRILVRGSDEERERLFTRYLPPLEIIERNSDPAPKPSPSPSPSPDDKKSGEDGDGKPDGGGATDDAGGADAGAGNGDTTEQTAGS